MPVVSAANSNQSVSKIAVPVASGLVWYSPFQHCLNEAACSRTEDQLAIHYVVPYSKMALLILSGTVASEHIHPTL